MDGVVAMDIIRDRGPVSRLDVVDSGRRRRFSDEAKLAIVAESYRGPKQVSATARRHGITRFQLNSWRKAHREGRLGAGSWEGFVPALHPTLESFEEVYRRCIGDLSLLRTSLPYSLWHFSWVQPQSEKLHEINYLRRFGSLQPPPVSPVGLRPEPNAARRVPGDHHGL